MQVGLRPRLKARPSLVDLLVRSRGHSSYGQQLEGGHLPEAQGKERVAVAPVGAATASLTPPPLLLQQEQDQPSAAATTPGPASVPGVQQLPDPPTPAAAAAADNPPALLLEQASTIPLPPSPPTPHLSPATTTFSDPAPESPLRIIPTVLINSASPSSAQSEPAPEPARNTPTSIPKPVAARMAPVSFRSYHHTTQFPWLTSRLSTCSLRLTMRSIPVCWGCLLISAIRSVH